MRRSWAFPFYDLALLIGLLLPLAFATALMSNREKAAVVYILLLITVVALSILVARFSKLTLRSYWGSFKQDGSR